jgi:hypothetical protein
MEIIGILANQEHALKKKEISSQILEIVHVFEPNRPVLGDFGRGVSRKSF